MRSENASLIQSNLESDLESYLIHSPLRSKQSDLGYVDGQPIGLSSAAASCRDSFLFHSKRHCKQLGFSHNRSL